MIQSHSHISVVYGLFVFNSLARIGSYAIQTPFPNVMQMENMSELETRNSYEKGPKEIHFHSVKARRHFENSIIFNNSTDFILISRMHCPRKCQRHFIFIIHRMVPLPFNAIAHLSAPSSIPSCRPPVCRMA